MVEYISLYKISNKKFVEWHGVIDGLLFMITNIIRMKPNLYYAVWLSVSSVLAGPPVVTVKPVAVEVSYSSKNTPGQGCLSLEMSVPDGMCLAYPERPWFRYSQEFGRKHDFGVLLSSFADGSFVPDGSAILNEVFVSESSYRKSFIFQWHQVPMDGSVHVDDVLPMRVMPMLRDSPSMTLDVKEEGMVQNGESTIRVVGPLKDHNTAVFPYSFDLEVIGQLPVMELAFSKTDDSTCVSFQKMPYGGAFDKVQGGIRQICRVYLDRQMIDKNQGKIDMVLRYAQGSGSVVNVPVKMDVDMQGMISARNEADSTARLVHVRGMLTPFRDDSGDYVVRGLSLSFETPLPQGYQHASLFGCLSQPQANFSWSEMSGKQILPESTSSFVGSREDDRMLTCFVDVGDMRSGGDFAYQGEFLIAVASGKEDSAVHSINVRKGEKLPMGDYELEVVDCVKPTANGSNDGYVQLAIHGGLEPAGLKVKSADGSMQEAVYQGGQLESTQINGNAAVNYRALFKVALPSIPDKLDISVETWRDWHLHKVPVKGQVSLKVESHQEG